MKKHTGEFERFEHAGRTVVLCFDDQAQSPRDNDGCLATIACWHRRNNLGDRQLSRTDGVDYEDRGAMVASLEEGGDKVLALIPVWIYQHSGTTLRAAHDNPFHCRWDSGQVGWAYVLRSTATKLGCIGTYLAHDGEKVTWDEARYEAECVREVETYDRWGRGEFAGYIVEDDEGDELDSCWGFDDVDYCRKQARAAAEDARSPGQVDGGCTATCEG